MLHELLPRARHRGLRCAREPCVLAPRARRRDYRTRTLGCLVAALGIAAECMPVQAQQVGDAADSRWYLSLQLGRAGYDTPLENRDTPWWGDVEDSGGAFAFGVGHRVLPQLDVRLLYERAWNIEATNVCPPGAICPAVVFTEGTTTESLSLVALPRLRFASGWSVFATAGALGWQVSPGGEIPRDRSLEVLIGVGVGYDFAVGVSFELEYQRAGFGADLDYDALRLGVSFHF